MTTEATRLLSRALRVDHAGEYGARRIYEGQLAVLSGTDAEPALREMLEQECEHLAAFDSLLREYGVRPTALQPFWHIGGFFLGAVTAMMGRASAFACTVAVEEVIEKHYQQQVESLAAAGAGDAALRARLTRFAEEEAAHRETALAEGGASGSPLLQAAVRGITRGAIRLSERL